MPASKYSIYLKNLQRKGDLDVFERMILKLKYENRGVCTEFSWLRNKSNISLWQVYKTFRSVKTRYVMIGISN